MDARLPFSFAQRHGIFVGPTTDQEIVLYCRADTQPQALQEARRLYKREFSIRILETGEFDQQLQKTYANQSGSLSIMDDVQESVMGMDEVAAAFEEPEDL